MIKKEHDSLLFEARTYINGETAIKPYYYLRNGLLHVRYTVDRCLQLSPDEIKALKLQMTSEPAKKQEILMNAWNFQTQCVGKPIIHDGIAEIERRMKEYKDGREN